MSTITGIQKAHTVILKANIPPKCLQDTIGTDTSSASLTSIESSEKKTPETTVNTSDSSILLSENHDSLSELPNKRIKIKKNKQQTFSDKLCDILCENGESTNIKRILNEFKLKGISDDDPRIESLILTLKEEIIISKKGLLNLIQNNIEMFKKIFMDDFVVKKFDLFCEKIKNIYNKIKLNNSGKVASYIPQLAKVNPNKFGISICTIDGQRYNLGDYNEDFCIQSCCKIINYCIAYEEHGDIIHKYVGKEPSGVSFNALTLDSTGKPHNPCINAGAIMVASLINNKYVSNNDIDSDEDNLIDKCSLEANRFEYLCNIYKKLCINKVGFNNSVYLSERATGHRNYALGHFMMEQNPGFPPKTNLKDVLEFYFQCCSLEITTNKLSILASTLANGGVNPLTGEQVFCNKTVKNCLSLMNSCGMYDFSGEFAFSIGIPSKSGVGGGIFSVIPGLMGISIWSPPLDNMGNSVRGVQFLKYISKEFNWHHFDTFNAKSEYNSYTSQTIIDSNDSPNKYNNNMDNNTDKVSTILQLHEHNEISLYKTIHYASVGDVGGLQRLYLRGFDLSKSDYDKRTPLHLASANGHLHIVKYLSTILPLSKMNPKDRWGNTPLIDAKRENHIKVYQFLKKYSH